MLLVTMQVPGTSEEELKMDPFPWVFHDPVKARCVWMTNWPSEMNSLRRDLYFPVKDHLRCFSHSPQVTHPCHIFRIKIGA